MASHRAAASLLIEVENEARLMLPPVVILIPAFGSADKLRICLESLARCLPAGRPTTYVLDDATPDESVKQACEAAKGSFPELQYRRSDVNRGFVATCNWGLKVFLPPSHDLLLLNSDTEVTDGFLDELQSVLHLHEKHGVAMPRSNKATIFSIAFEAWQAVRFLQPRYQMVPTVVGFCMLIKAQVLDRFGLFDEIYSPGYNEENDFVCRINRYGYSAVAANQAFVFHRESSSFGARRAALEKEHRRILLERYPEFERKVAEYVRFEMDPVDVFSELWLPHKPRVLFDLFHLTATHSGTSDFALNLLREVGRLAEPEFELFVGIDEALPFFSQELRGYRIYQDRANSRMIFDLLYKPCQVFTWIDYARMTRLSPRVAYTLQDIIGVRCQYLSGANRQILFRKTAELSDQLFTISEFSRDDFNAFYGTDIPMQVIYHGTNAGMTPGEFRQGEYVLVMGNAFAHKGVSEALLNLNVDLPVVVLGGKKTGLECKNVRMLESGGRSRQQMRDLFVRARVVVYPSYYEGFGLPVVDALALGKPVVVLESSVNRELAELVCDRNLHSIDSLKQLIGKVTELFGQPSGKPPGDVRRWRTAGEEYMRAWRELVARAIDVAKLRARFDAVRVVQSTGA